MSPLLPGLIAMLMAGQSISPEPEPIAKMHPYLAQRMLEAGADQILPVYFVMRDRLPIENFFPRVNTLGIKERREVVMAELKAFATRSQTNTLRTLRHAEGAGRAEAITSNWLGNFVLCRATPGVILQVLQDDSVEIAWFDHVPTPEELHDGVAVAGTAAVPNRSPALSMGLAPGNGPIDTQADDVWALGITGVGVLVMNSDDGVNASHTDLAGRLWTNPGEIPGNGIDDDANGLVDDINGWNFGSNNASISDSGGHGTQTAGCIVGDGTCNGTIYGQAPGARLMTGRLGGEASQWNAVQYAIDKGADCQTSSHSYKNNFVPPPNYKMHRTVADNSMAAGLIRTNSTSNNGSSCNSTTSTVRKPFNIAAPGCVPAPYVDANQTLGTAKSGVVGVAAYNVGTSTLASYSPCGPFAWNLPDVQVVLPTYPVANWSASHNDFPWTGGTQQGLLKPDISAPTGTTTTSGSGTCGTTTFSGTSNATPVANGVFCLWKSANPSLKPEDVAMIAHQTAVDIGSVPGKENNSGAGKINALAGLDLALCVHRINGEPAWKVNHSVAASIAIEADTLPGATVLFAVGTARTAVQTHGGVIGIAPVTIYSVVTADANGNVTLTLPIPPTFIGGTLFSQVASVDTQITGTPGTPRLLTSNVVQITFVP